MWPLLKGSLAHWPRVAHTAAGVALAVSLVTGTFVLTDTIDDAFGRASAPAPAPGEVDLVVRSAAAFRPVGETDTEREPMPASVLTDVQAVPGVAAAWGAVWGYAELVGPDGRPLVSDGLPAVGAAWAPDATLTAGHAPRGPHEVAVDVTTARRNGLRLGDRIKILFQDVVQEFVIGGISGVSRLVSSTLASFDLATAQRMLGQDAQLGAISVRAAPGVTAETVRANVGAALPARFEVVTADQAAKQAKESWTRALGFLTTGLLMFAGVALLVGGFLIFNTFSILVAHRARELGLLRALGASRAQVTWSVLGEALVVGTTASAAGILGGLGAARGLLMLLRAVGLSTPSTSVVLNGRTVVVGLLAGALVTAIAAVQPARRATRVSPMVAIEGEGGRGDESLRRRVRAGAGATAGGLAALAVGLFTAVPGSLIAVGAGVGAVLVGLAMLAPLAVGLTARMVGTPLVRMLGEPGLLGRENALRSPRRTAATASALMIGIGLIGVVGVLGASMKESATRTIRSSMRADFVVATHQVPGSSNGVPPVAAERLRQSPAVDTVSEVRTGQWGLGGRAQTLIAIDPSTVTRVYNLDPASAAAASRLDDEGVLVRETVAGRHGWRVGDQVPMTFARTGTRQVRLQGVYSTTTVRSDYVISIGAFAANYSDQLDLEVDVLLVPGTSIAAGRQAIRTALVDFPNLAVRDRSEVMAFQEEQVNRLLVPMVALLALSVVIALLGIANTLALSVHERIRELGLLRAIGMARGQLRAMIRAEAVIIASLGAALGVAVAVFFGWVAVFALGDQGVTRTVFPVGQLAGLALVATAASLVAAALPARRASRLRLLDAVASA